MNSTFSRRDSLKLMLNMGVATFAGSSILHSTNVFAQQATAVLGHFGSANPQTLGKASGSFAQGVRLRREDRFRHRRQRRAGHRRHCGQQHGHLQRRLVADGGGLRAGHQDVDGLRREVHHGQRVPRGAQGCRHQHAEGPEGQEDRHALQHVGAFRDARRLEDSGSHRVRRNVSSTSRPTRSWPRGSARTSTGLTSGTPCWATCWPTTASCC